MDEPWRLPAEVMCRVQHEKTWSSGQRGCILRPCQGQNGNPGYIAYNTSKAAVSHFTRVVAAQYAPKGIRCNSVCPGLMRTPLVEKSLADHYAGGDVEEMFRIRAAQVPMGKGGDAWDVAYASLYLASDEAKYVTGAELVVDGGLTLKCT